MNSRSGLRAAVHRVRIWITEPSSAVGRAVLGPQTYTACLSSNDYGCMYIYMHIVSDPLFVTILAQAIALDILIE